MLYYTILIKHISLYLLFLFNIKFSLQSGTVTNLGDFSTNQFSIPKS